MMPARTEFPHQGGARGGEEGFCAHGGGGGDVGYRGYGGWVVGVVVGVAAEEDVESCVEGEVGG